MSENDKKPQNPEEDVDLLFLVNPEDIVEVIELNEDDYPDESSGDEENENDDNDNDEGATKNSENSTTEPDDAVVFEGHDDAVFCVRIEPIDFKYAVTGGQDDKAFVWDVKTGTTLFECTGHKDSVTSVAFSHDGEFIATGDLSGFIQVWDFATQKAIWDFECSDIEWLQWHPETHLLFAGTADGNMWMWKISINETKTFTGHGQSATSGVIFPDGKRACVGYKDGTMKIWNLKTTSCIHTISGVNAHASSVVSLACHPDNVLVVSGSTDNTAKLFNSETGKVVATLPCKSMPGAEPEDESVETVGFSELMPWVATGNLAGELEIWDLSTHIVRQRCHHERGIVKLMWDKASPFVYTACLDGRLRLWDARNGELVRQWKGHQAEILDFDISFEGNIVVTTSEDKTARVFSTASMKS